MLMSGLVFVGWVFHSLVFIALSGFEERVLPRREDGEHPQEGCGVPG